MRNRKVKCRFCQNEETYPETDMYIELTGKESKTKKYWHFDCFEKEKIRREKVNEETRKWDMLYETVKEIHDAENLPKDIICALQDLRNGTKRFRSQVQIGYKKGIEYPIITKAYNMSRKNIEYARNTKNFKDTKNEMKYCLEIVKDKISDAKKEIKRMKKLEDTYVNPFHSYSEYEIEPVKKFPKI